METSQFITDRARPGLFVFIVLAALTLYCITYSARIESGDAAQLFDAASSLVHFGDLRLDETLWRTPVLQPVTDFPYPLGSYEVIEPFAPFVASLFYRLAALADVGFVHAVWWMNGIITALSAGLLFSLSRLLGYDVRVAVLGAVVFAACTVVWPYSKTLFREPLVMFGLLTAAIAIVRARRSKIIARVLWLLLVLLALALAWLTKNSSIFAWPVLIIFALLPARIEQRRFLRLFDALLLIGLIVLMVSIYVQPVSDLVAVIINPLLSRFNVDWELARIALHSYLFSIGGSIWGTSPILLLAIAGFVMLRHAGRWREIWLGLGMLLSIAVGHALLTGVHWFGGLSWPPRFLVPTVPFLMLLVLPAMERLLRVGVRLFWRLGALLLAVYSLFIQIVASVSFIESYGGLIPQSSGGLVEWLPGLNSVQYLRWLLLPQIWAETGFNIAWIRAAQGHILLAYLGLLLLLSGMGWSLLKGRSHPRLLAGGVFAWVIVSAIGLRGLHQSDDLYWANHQQLFEARTILETEASDGEPLILPQPIYDRFIMNYLRSDAVRPLVFGFQPGEAQSDDEPPRITSTYVMDLLTQYTPRLLDGLAQWHERAWLLSNTSPFLTWSVRPVERFMAENYYLLRRVETPDPTVRLLAYDLSPAPERIRLERPQTVLDFRFGEAIKLGGITLPRGTRYVAGDSVPLTLFWQADAPISQDYVVASFIVKDDASILPVQGVDTMPVAGFMPTSTWQPQQLIYDNRAIQLPTDAPEGDYQIWVLMYEAGSSGGVRLPVTGDSVQEGEIAILPITIQIIAVR